MTAKSFQRGSTFQPVPSVQLPLGANVFPSSFPGIPPRHKCCAHAGRFGPREWSESCLIPWKSIASHHSIGCCSWRRGMLAWNYVVSIRVKMKPRHSGLLDLGHYASFKVSLSADVFETAILEDDLKMLQGHSFCLPDAFAIAETRPASQMEKRDNIGVRSGCVPRICPNLLAGQCATFQCRASSLLARCLSAIFDQFKIHNCAKISQKNPPWL